MIERSWVTQKIMDAYGSKRGLLKSISFGAQNLISGKYRRYGQLPDRVERVIFVCKGNICRSAVAEYAFRAHSALPTASVGLDTHTGKEGNARITAYAGEAGLDMSPHRATAITDFKPGKGDLFVCMEPEHAHALEGAGSTTDIILLGCFGQPRKLYLHDPYISTDAYAKQCTFYIIDATKRLANNLEATKEERR